MARAMVTYWCSARASTLLFRPRGLAVPCHCLCSLLFSLQHCNAHVHPPPCISRHSTVSRLVLRSCSGAEGLSLSARAVVRA